MSVRWIAPANHAPTDDDLEQALATIRAALPPSLVVLFALHLDAMKKERAIGHLGAEFHMSKGDVRSASFERRTAWQRMEPVDVQRPVSGEPKP